MLTLKERKANRKKRFRLVLCNKDLTQRKAADIIGVSQPTLARIADDPGRLTLEQAFRLGLSDTDLCRLKNGN
jgi:predicted DNA-binding protein (UPF0251 family)